MIRFIVPSLLCCFCTLSCFPSTKVQLSRTKSRSNRVREQLKTAINSYTYGSYKKAIREFAMLLYSQERHIHSKHIRARVHKYLGISSYYLYLRTMEKKYKKRATSEFRRLLLIHPNHQLDPLHFPPNLIQFFEGLKKKARLRFILSRLGP